MWCTVGHLNIYLFQLYISTILSYPYCCHMVDGTKCQYLGTHYIVAVDGIYHPMLNKQARITIWD